MREVDSKELKTWIDSNKKCILLDVRARDYFYWEHVPNAVNLRWKYIDAKAGALLPDKDACIVTYCQSYHCTASTKAYQALEKLGFRNLYEFSGGLSDWTAHGFLSQSDPRYRKSENHYYLSEQEVTGTHNSSLLIVDDEALVLINGPHRCDDDVTDFLASFNKPIRIVSTSSEFLGETNLLKTTLNAEILNLEARVEERVVLSTHLSMQIVSHDGAKKYQLIDSRVKGQGIEI